MSEEKKRLLVLDDSREFIFLLTSLFDYHKLEVDAENDPDVALKLASENNYDAIMTDYMMDKMDGLSFAESIRSSEDCKGNCKIILLTAKNLDNTELQKVNDLKITYLKKPILPNTLKEKILELIG